MTSFRLGDFGLGSVFVHEVLDDLQPYSFEPERIPNAEDSENEEVNNRLEGTFWCTCEQCETLPTYKENVFVSENSQSQKTKM